MSRTLYTEASRVLMSFVIDATKYLQGILGILVLAVHVLSSTGKTSVVVIWSHRSNIYI